MFFRADLAVRRWIGAAFLMLFCITVLSSCEKKIVKVTETKSVDQTLVGFSLATLKEDRWLRDRNIFIAKARQEGLEVIAKNANNDSDVQYKHVVELLDAGIDILVIVAYDGREAARCVQAAKDRNVPVVCYDRLILDSNVDAYVSFDNFKAGKLMGEYLTESVPKGGYIILNGPKEDNNSSMFHAGYMSVLNPLIYKGDIDVLAETWVDDWTRELAFNFTSESVKEYRNEVGAILCANDSLAWGAIDALSESRMTGSVQIVGHEADLVACQRIVNGTQLMTVYKPISNLVSKTVEVCVKLLHAQNLQSENTINDGTYDVPYFMIDVVAVTKDTMDETVIKDGFHIKEDVYRTGETD